MARRHETLDDLLRPILDTDTFTAWCLRDAGLRPWTVLRLRQGQGRAHRGTVLALEAGLRLAGIRATEKRIRAAIAASKSAAESA